MLGAPRGLKPVLYTRQEINKRGSISREKKSRKERRGRYRPIATIGELEVVETSLYAHQ